MSLFPAYGQDNVESGFEYQGKEVSLSPKREAFLLKSDDESPPRSKACRSPPPAPPPPSCDCYLDRKPEDAYARYSTLYYPARPHYPDCEKRCALGAAAAPRRRSRKRPRRYFQEPPASAEPLDEELAARLASFRRLLADSPQDADLWIKFINFQERCVSAAAALEAAAEACTRAPASAALRRLRRDLARAHLPLDQYLTMLRDQISAESRPSMSAELWVWLVEAAGGAPGSGPAHVIAAAAHAARRPAAHYPRLLYAVGSYLSAAGLWELLVLLVELVAAMSFPASAAFPPAADAERDERAERRLADAEDAAAASRLPLAARWARVERARAAAHWRPAPHLPAHALSADPQRAPLASDVAALLQALAPRQRPALALRLLLLAKVPLLPGAGWVSRALGVGVGVGGGGGGQAILPLIRAARRLPHAQRAPPAAAAAALAMLDAPPHYYTPADGFAEWVDALWDACIEWVGAGHARLALVCWRLRWLHTLLLLLDPEAAGARAEARRVRGVARRVVRAHGPHPLPFLHFARIEALVNGAEAGRAAAALAARALLGAAGGDTGAAGRLWAARLLAELGAAPAARWLLVCAVLDAAPPEDFTRPDVSEPPASLLAAALARCEEQCSQLEQQWAEAGADEAEAEAEAAAEAEVAALLPGAAEWAAARVALAPPARVRQLYTRATDHPPPAHMSLSEAWYREAEACALLGAAHAQQRAARWAPTLAAMFPDNAYLAMACGGAPLWAGVAGAGGGRLSECSALALFLPPLLRALGAGASGAGAGVGEGAGAEAAGRWRRAARAARRASRAGCGVVSHVAAVQLAASPAAAAALDPRAALYAALQDHPTHKWLYVLGAALTPEGAALADVVLERQLRLHALPLELHHEPEPEPEPHTLHCQEQQQPQTNTSI